MVGGGVQEEIRESKSVSQLQVTVGWAGWGRGVVRWESAEWMVGN